MFYDINGEKFRRILDAEEGLWIISYDNPSTPVYVTNASLKNYEVIDIPKEYIVSIEIDSLKKTQAERQRLDMIESLLIDERNIYDKNHRNNTAQACAEKYHTNKKTVLRLYFKYLARRCVLEKKSSSAKNLKKYKDYDWAIKKYYFSAKKITLRATYDMLLLERYSDQNGMIISDPPTWDSFQHYFYRNNLNKASQKEISRNGLSNYQRNNRPLFGNANHWKRNLGHYQMDATEADIYLVSRYDNRVVVGRPYVYLAVDTLTQLIAGIYIGFNCDDTSVIACLANAAKNKVDYCKEYGIEITKEQWPSDGLPKSIITDQGREFMSHRVEQLCQKYDMDLENLPPFRPDTKSLVEKTFDIIQSRYKSYLRGKGVVEADAMERWAEDYRNQASINIDEYTRIIIHCVLYINSRWLDNYIPNKDMIYKDVRITPSTLWNYYAEEGKSRVIPINKDDMYILSLNRKKATLNRKGISHNGLWYKSDEILRLLMEVKCNKVDIFYDINDISNIYMFHKNEYIVFHLPDYYEVYSSLSMSEYEYARGKIKEQRNKDKNEQNQLRVNLIKEIKTIVQDKRPENKTKINSQSIEANKKREGGCTYE